MKKIIFSIIFGTIALLILALACDYIYKLNRLNQVFGKNISYSQWIGIVVIIKLLIDPSLNYSSRKNDQQGS